MPLRVLFVTTTYPLHQGDAIPGFVADLARTLVKNHDIRIKVIAPHHGGAARSETVDGVEIERFQYTPDPSHQCLSYGNGIPDNLRQFRKAKWQLPSFLTAMATAIHRNLDETDLIHAHWIEPAFIAALANFMRRKPLVVSVHSMKPNRSLIHKHTLAIADRVLFNSNHTMSQSDTKGYVCNSEVVYQGYDDALFGNTLRTGNDRLEGDIPENSVVVTAIGRMIEVKGFHVLAESADGFLTARPDVHLVFAGDGPCRAEVEAIGARSPNRARIHFAGALHRRLVAQLLADSDIFVNPGVIDGNGRAEGLGITTIEAMASGLPVVASRVGGIPETIVDQSTGLLIPPGDPIALATAIRQLIDDPQRRASMGHQGRTIARQRFAWPALAARVMGVYTEASGGSVR